LSEGGVSCANVSFDKSNNNILITWRNSVRQPPTFFFFFVPSFPILIVFYKDGCIYEFSHIEYIGTTFHFVPHTTFMGPPQKALSRTAILSKTKFMAGDETEGCANMYSVGREEEGAAVSVRAVQKMPAEPRAKVMDFVVVGNVILVLTETKAHIWRN
jgi:hypothetical protein